MQACLVFLQRGPSSKLGHSWRATFYTPKSQSVYSKNYNFALCTSLSDWIMQACPIFLQRGPSSKLGHSWRATFYTPKSQSVYSKNYNFALCTSLSDWIMQICPIFLRRPRSELDHRWRATFLHTKILPSILYNLFLFLPCNQYKYNYNFISALTLVWATSENAADHALGSLVLVYAVDGW